MENELLTLIKCAINNIDKSYFKVQTAGSNNLIARERVYCYELYHQMRLLQKRNYNYPNFNIHGEIDKKGNLSFEKKTGKILTLYFMFQVIMIII